MTKSYFVYVLRCADGSLYTGYTSDLARRLAEHQAGKGARYTRSRRPVELARYWSWRDRQAAMRVERLLKGLARRQKEALLSGAETAVPPGVMLRRPGDSFR